MTVTTTQTLVCDKCGKTKMTMEGKVWSKDGLVYQSKKAGWKSYNNGYKQACPQCASKVQKPKKSPQAKKSESKKSPKSVGQKVNLKKVEKLRVPKSFVDIDALNLDNPNGE